MATIDNMRVLFGQGTSVTFATETKQPNKLYFLSDTQEMYLGSVRYALGKDVTVYIVGSGDTVAGASWDSNTKTLTITLGDAGTTASVQSAIELALSTCVKHIRSATGSAIVVDDSDKDDVQISLNLASGSYAGNVQLEESSDGLRANVDIPAPTVTGVAAGDKILSLNGTYLASTLSITTEAGVDGKQYVILKGINGAEISKFDASDFVSSGILQSVTIEDLPVGSEIHKFLVMTFYVEGGETETIKVDLNDLMTTYSAAVGGGLSLSEGNEFSIANNVTPNYGVNVDHTIQFNSSVTLKTFSFDAHGLVTGVHDIVFNIPGLTGSVGTSGDTSKLLTFVSMSSDGVISGEYINVVKSVSSASTDLQIPTAKAVYDLVDNATTKWERF